MTRATRQHPRDAGKDSIADDLLLAREAGGIAEAGLPQLEGTLWVLGLEEPTSEDVTHARDTLEALAATTLAEVLAAHPVRVREDNQTTPGTRLAQAWQTVAATSLTASLVTTSGSKGQIVDARGHVAGRFVLSAGTVKRYEDKLITTVLAPNIHQRLTASPPARTRRPAGIDHPRDDRDRDPLWKHLGSTEAELAEALLRNGRLPGAGFDGQEIGRDEPSRASTGMVTYVLGMTPTISDDAIAELYDEILGWITPGGTLPRSQSPGAKSTWTESQCLLALTARPHLIDGPQPRRLADALLRQQHNGAWAYRGTDTGPLHPVWTFYPLLSLNRATQAEWISGLRYRGTAQRAAHHTASYLDADHPLTERLIALATLRLACSGTSAQNWDHVIAHHTEILDTQTRHLDPRSLEPISMADDHQPLWHARINPALLYLHSRRALGRAHPFTLALIDRLLADYDAINQGWTNSPNPGAKPYTWTTAIALCSCQIIRAEIREGAIPMPSIPGSAAEAARAADTA